MQEEFFFGSAGWVVAPSPLPPPHANKQLVCMQEVVCAQKQCKFVWVQQGKVGSVDTQLVEGLKAKQNVEVASTSLLLLPAERNLNQESSEKGKQSVPSSEVWACAFVSIHLLHCLQKKCKYFFTPQIFYKICLKLAKFTHFTSKTNFQNRATLNVSKFTQQKKVFLTF